MKWIRVSLLRTNYKSNSTAKIQTSNGKLVNTSIGDKIIKLSESY